MKDLIKRLFSTAAIANIVLAIALVALTSWGIASVRKQFNDSVKNDFAAAALLAKIQLHGERMRRYEKESFIYLANPARRDKYVNEHADAYKKLLEDLDTALMPSGRAFTDEQRVVILKWKLASIFYVSEFKRLVDDARDLPAESANAGLLATEYNERIKAGKDRFAILLTGAGDMRLVKERASQEAAQTIDLMFTRLVWLVIGIVGAGGIGLQLLLGRRRPRDTRGHRKFADSRPDWTLAQ